ncbi:cell division protein FtsW [Paraliobacillus quinghaiensis]|uniref:Cell division protein FtsW n=1 Tax=Paraliobacillus quinghaiensis TaxID=470815 RepID=A0A917TIR4_9BACI|nr:FtsW/RodA/SpoVE family cell cycle protein [Paraliobacillus quinghaiensis]GGM24740.1 cell division protein FtsW [Paraliobacillus quinghaiensis]
MESKNKTANIDYTLILIIILLGIISVFSIYTIQDFLLLPNYYIKQIVWYIAGAITIGVIMLVDYDRLRQVSWVFYSIGMIMLIMLHFHFPPGIAKEVNGAWGWFEFPVLGTLQPAEFMKVFLVIALAHLIVIHNEKFKEHTNKSDCWLLAKILLVALPPMGLIALQPDLGGFLVLSAITVCMILVSGIRWRIIFSLVGLALVALMSILMLYIYFPEAVDTFIEDNEFGHVESRFTSWLNPEAHNQGGAYQLIRVMRAIGSGQLSGKGVGGFEVSHIPERHTDMIFTSIAEQFGFIGSSILITLFFLLIYRLIHIGLQSNDPFGSYIVTGIIGMFTYQIFQNIGMSIGLLPITGLPLPFISYGGSSTLTYMIAIGIVLNIHYRTKVYMFDS